jgi:hypothetical protein
MTQTQHNHEDSVDGLKALRRRVFELQALVAKRKTADQALYLLQLAIQQREPHADGRRPPIGQMSDSGDERDM